MEVNKMNDTNTNEPDEILAWAYPEATENEQPGDIRKRIALVAHDNKKVDLLEWALFNRDLLVQHSLVATGTTGRLLSQALVTPVTCLKSGPLGGDQQIGALIAEGALDLLIFFWDPLEQQPHGHMFRCSNCQGVRRECRYWQRKSRDQKPHGHPW